MAQRASVNLSDLPEGDHLVKDASNQGTCVVYMKLTEACVKAIDALLAAKKGANDCGLCVTFNPSGGTFSVPGDAHSEAKDFEFQTNKIEKGSVECLHQHRLIQGSKQAGQTLSNLGSIHHKLSIKATDDVYETTKTKALEAEEERKESHRVKPIEKLPSSRALFKHKRPTEIPNSHQLKVPKKQEEPVTSNSTNLRIIRDRVIHFLALKPHRKVDLHNRLKKDKHCENLLNHLDPVLLQVAEPSAQDRTIYILKASYYAEVKVDSFPKYSDQERVNVRRNLQEAGIKVPSSGVKRTAATEDSPNTTKRAKSHSTLKLTKPLDTATTTTTTTTNVNATATTIITTQTMDNDTLARNPVTETVTNSEPIKKIPSNDAIPTAGDPKKHKKKKKHKHAKEDTSEGPVVATKPSPQQALLPSVPPMDDDLSQFSTIRSHEQRARYKEEFNTEYKKYLELKKKIDLVTQEFTALRDQLAGYPKKSDDYKKLSRSIKKRYTEKQNDETYQQEKQQYQQLCTKLNHIKKLVVEYDNFIVERNL